MKKFPFKDFKPKKPISRESETSILAVVKKRIGFDVNFFGIIFISLNLLILTVCLFYFQVE